MEKYLGIIRNNKVDQQDTICKHKKKMLLVYFYKRRNNKGVKIRNGLLEHYFDSIKPFENIN
jgi:hypothetical protein